MAQRTIIAENRRVQALELQHRKDIWDSYQSYVASWREAEARAKSIGRPGPNCLPHPDDIEFGENLAVYVRGPTTAEELATSLILAANRDLFLAVSMYRSWRNKYDDDSPDVVDLWAFGSFVFNASLPRSLRLSDDEVRARETALLSSRPSKLEDHIRNLCEKLHWPFKLLLQLARKKGAFDIRMLGLRRVHGSIVVEPRWSAHKMIERIWANVSFENLTAENLDLMEMAGLAGPPSWMTRARASIAAREAGMSGPTVELNS